MYLIWSFEHHAWWAAASMGYVQTIESAGRYTATEAGAIVTNSVWNDEVAILESRAKREGPPKFHPYAGDNPNYYGG